MLSCTDGWHTTLQPRLDLVTYPKRRYRLPRNVGNSKLYRTLTVGQVGRRSFLRWIAVVWSGQINIDCRRPIVRPPASDGVTRIGMPFQPNGDSPRGNRLTCPAN